MDYIMISLSAK